VGKGIQGKRRSEFQRAELRHLLSDQICFSRSVNSASILVSLLIAMPSVRLLRGGALAKTHTSGPRAEDNGKLCRACRLLALCSPSQSQKCRLRRLRRSILASFQDGFDFGFVAFKFRIAEEFFLRHQKIRTLCLVVQNLRTVKIPSHLCLIAYSKPS